MEFKIKVEKLKDGDYMASVNWKTADGGKVGTSGAVSYATNEKEAYKYLKEKLEKKGHKILN